MTSAYGVFANHGLLVASTLIRRVEGTDGEILYEAAPRPQRVLSQASAFMMTSMLADVVNAGTAWKARKEGFTLPAAALTADRTE